MKTITEYLQSGHIHKTDDLSFAYYDSFDAIQPDDWVVFKNDSNDIVITQVKSSETTNMSFKWEFYYQLKIGRVSNSIVPNFHNSFKLLHWHMLKWTDAYKNVVRTFLNAIDKHKVSTCNIDAIKNGLLWGDIEEIGNIDTNLNISIKQGYIK